MEHTPHELGNERTRFRSLYVWSATVTVYFIQNTKTCCILKLQWTLSDDRTYSSRAGEWTNQVSQSVCLKCFCDFVYFIQNTKTCILKLRDCSELYRTIEHTPHELGNERTRFRSLYVWSATVTVYFIQNTKTCCILKLRDCSELFLFRTEFMIVIHKTYTSYAWFIWNMRLPRCSLIVWYCVVW